ncbi:putative ribosomal-protein-alanine acetyltransferase [Prochlorococcus marinus str. MIT 9211]|uniref:Putative ribosomal-protein-alanine acetyltransferase n=2 Tax=Prochlorococcus marinus TaxID=1219 RepID=A9BB16_PROM4|nr:putative ribosomal-protein-alanine acetyltransferase [Prochlorococcus marinus str. MIT 9211]
MRLNDIALNGLWSKSQWEYELKSDYRHCLGVSEQESLIAISCGWIVANQLDITAVAVDPRYRRLGLGSKILCALINHAKSKGATNATLEVNEENIDGINFYRSLGFLQVGYRKNYYKDLSSAILFSLYIDQ